METFSRLSKIPSCRSSCMRLFLASQNFMCSPFVLVPVSIVMYSKQNWISKSPVYECTTLWPLSQRSEFYDEQVYREEIERDSRCGCCGGVLLLLCEMRNAMRLAGVRTNIDRYRNVCRVLYGKRSNLTSRIFDHSQ